jgi:hypothetical protein
LGMHKIGIAASCIEIVSTPTIERLEFCLAFVLTLTRGRVVVANTNHLRIVIRLAFMDVT